MRIGPYLVVQTLGSGGMGVVYLAEPVGGGPRVALKTVTERREAVYFGIRREVRALRALEHPGVVRVLDDGTHEGAPFYAMEVLEGPTLRSYRRARAATPDPLDLDLGMRELGSNGSDSRPISSQRAASSDALRPHALSVVRSVCETLAFVHGRGIVHRDLKPDNVILTEERGPVLVDFGIAALALGARTREVLETAGRAYGSPGYMAPEQIRGELVDARADLYAIGSMLYECVTGRPPFEADGVRALLSKKLHADPPRASHFVADVPVALDDLIARLLSRRREDRPGHAVDVATALAALGAQRLGPEGPPGEPCLYRPRISGRDDALAHVDRAISDAMASSPKPSSSDIDYVVTPPVRAAPTRVENAQRTNASRTSVRTAARGDAVRTLDVTSGLEAAPAHGSVMWVSGESGVGKTRLVMEAATVAARRGFTVVTGECVHVASDEDAAQGLVSRALHPFRGLLQAFADARRDVEGLDADLGVHVAVLATFEPSLRALAALDMGGLLEMLPPDAARARVNEALFGVISAFAERTPTLLVLDDLQWADEPSLRFLESLEGDRLGALPIVLVGTYRADEAPPLLRSIVEKVEGIDLRLRRLGSESLAAIVRDMLAVDEVPDELVRFLERESDGNPFFVAEYLRAAVEGDLLVRDARGRFRLGANSLHGLADLPAPRALGEVVRARLERLDPRALEVARMSAVLGRVAELRVLADALETPDVFEGDAVTELLRRDVFEDQAGALRFVHDKLREAAYASIAIADRPRMHRAAARAIEAHAAATGDADGFVAELAHHHAESGDHLRALPLLDRAGALAARAGSYNDALRCFERALAIFADEPPHTEVARAERARWVRRAAEAHHATGDLRAAERRGREALRLASKGPTLLDRSYAKRPRERLEYVVAAGRAVLSQLANATRSIAGGPRTTHAELQREAALAAEKLAQTYLFLNDSTRAGLASVLAGNHAAALGPSPELARASSQLAIAATYVPAHGLARRYIGRATQIATAVGERDTELAVRFMRGFWGLGVSDGKAALADLEAARNLARDRQDHRREEESLALIGLAHTVRGRHGDALDTYDELATFSTRSQNLQSHIWATGGRAQVYARIGRASAAIEQFARIQSYVARTNDESEKVQLAHTAPMHIDAGDFDAAYSIASRTLRIIAHGPPAGMHLIFGYFATADAFFSLLDLAKGQLGERTIAGATRLSIRALTRFAKVFPVGRAEAERYDGRMDILEGRRSRGLAKLMRSVESARRFDLPVEEARAHADLARFGPRDRREACAERARELFTRTGTWGLMRRMESELSE